MISTSRAARRCGGGLLLLVLTGATAADSADPAPRLVVQDGHSKAVSQTAFSPDGKLALTARSGDHTARLWDVQTGKQLQVLQGASGGSTVAVFSPDGRQVLTGSGDATARLQDLQTGRPVHLFQCAQSVRIVAFSPDGKQALTLSSDNLVVLWNTATGKKVRDFDAQGPRDQVTGLTFSPDGKLVLTCSQDKTARLWNTATGKQVHQLPVQGGSEPWAAFSPNGKLVLTGNVDAPARLWDVKTGQQVHVLQGEPEGASGGAFSPDSKLALLGCYRSAQLWDVQTGKQLPLETNALRYHWNSTAFSPDGKLALTCSRGKGGDVAELYDVQTGKPVRLLEGNGQSVRAPVFSPDGTLVMAVTDDGVGRFWDVATGKPFHPRQATGAPVRHAAFGSNGKLVLGGRFDRTYWVWDALGGSQVRLLAGYDPKLVGSYLAFSPDGKVLLAGNGVGTARLLDVQTGKELRLMRESLQLASVAFSPDGARVFTGYTDGSGRLWDGPTGKQVHLLTGHAGAVLSAAFSPDGKRVLTSGWETKKGLPLVALQVLWDVETGQQVQSFRGPSRVEGRPFSPDGKRVLASGDGGAVWLRDAQTGQQLQSFKGQLARSEMTVAFSPDGKRLLSADWTEGTVRLWDVDTGKQLKTLEGHALKVRGVGFSPDGKHPFTVGDDKTTRFWDPGTGDELCRLVAFTDGSWAVVDPTGRYDASNGGDVEGLHWVAGLEPIALSQLKERYYDPNLLAKHLGFSKEPLRDVAAFKEVKLYPGVTVAQADPKKPQMSVTLTNRGGGIGKVVVLVNGKELTGDARPRGATDANAAKLDLKLDLSADPRLVPGQKNTVEVLAYNADGFLSSRGLVREFDAPGVAVAAPKPTLHAVVVGIAQYRGEKLNLRYAAKDAEDFAAAIKLAAAGLFGAESVRVHVLTANLTDTARCPTRANLVKALEALKATKPGDLVVVYLAGHGVTHGGQDGDWHYLTADAQSAELTDPAVRKAVTLSSAELTDLLKAAPAQKQVLILDTCHSGAVVAKLTEKRDVPGSQVRALERVKDRTGMHVLAGCAADSVSYEASKYGQGLLTYSLLLGMRGAKLREGEYVDIVDLFGFAADKVPELARDIGGVQRPTVASPRGTSFDVGRLTAEDRARVPLQTVKPLLLRASFQDEERVRDVLGLSRLVNDRLREASAAPRGAKLVFVDAEDFPGGVLVAGRYKVEGGKVTVSVTLFEGDKKTPFAVEGAAGKPDELAGWIAGEVEKRLAGGAK